VDVFERIRAAELNGEKLGLMKALEIIYEPSVEPHERRHQSEIVENIYKYLKLTPPAARKAA
jgi:hypothetical protein